MAVLTGPVAAQVLALPLAPLSCAASVLPAETFLGLAGPALDLCHVPHCLCLWEGALPASMLITPGCLHICGAVQDAGRRFLAGIHQQRQRQLLSPQPALQ